MSFAPERAAEFYDGKTIADLRAEITQLKADAMNSADAMFDTDAQIITILREQIVRLIKAHECKRAEFEAWKRTSERRIDEQSAEIKQLRASMEAVLRELHAISVKLAAGQASSVFDNLGLAITEIALAKARGEQPL